MRRLVLQLASGEVEPPRTRSTCYQTQAGNENTGVEPWRLQNLWLQNSLVPSESEKTC